MIRGQSSCSTMPSDRAESLIRLDRRFYPGDTCKGQRKDRPMSTSALFVSALFTPSISAETDSQISYLHLPPCIVDA